MRFKKIDHIAIAVNNLDQAIAFYSNHIAFEVDEVEVAAQALAQRCLQFDTSVINGGSLKQNFSSRDSNSGMSFEFIERQGEQGFLEENVHELFAQLEKSGAY